MDAFFANISLETFKTLPWFAAIVLGGIFAYVSYRNSSKEYWHVVVAIAQGLLVSVISFVALNLWIASYIFNHLKDSRWSAGKDTLLPPSELSSSIPGIKNILEELSAAQNRVIDAVNDVDRMKNALGVVGEFADIAGRAMLIALCLGLVVWWISKKWAPKRKANYEANKQKAEKEAERERLKYEAKDNAYRDKRLAALESHAGIKPPPREP